MYTIISFRKKFTTLLLSVAIYSIPTVVFGGQHLKYVSLSGLPQVSRQGASIADVLGSLFVIVISVAGLIAVIKITIAGIKYMLSDIVTTKEDAKNDIYGAFFGLAIILVSFVVLSTINPNLTNLNVLRSTGGLSQSPLIIIDTVNTTTATTCQSPEYTTVRIGSETKCVPTSTTTSGGNTTKTLGSVYNTSITKDDFYTDMIAFAKKVNPDFNPESIVGEFIPPVSDSDDTYDWAGVGKQTADECPGKVIRLSRQEQDDARFWCFI